MLTQQQLLTTPVNKPTSTTKETLIIIQIASSTTIPTLKNILTSNDNCKR